MELSTNRDMILTIAQTSNIGGRQTNQDALGMAEQGDLACFVVSDGAGGHHGGEVAANIVVHAVIDSFMRDLSFGSRALQSYVEEAIVQVALAKIKDETHSAMSATVATVLIDRKNWNATWAHMGDTRIYLFRDHKIYRMTKDHSVVQQFIDAGYCKQEEARTHPQRSVLFAAIGAEGETRLAVSDDAFVIEDGDALLICSDGLWEWVADAEMEQALTEATNVNDWLERMLILAETHSVASRQSRDNFTAFTLWLGEHKPAGRQPVTPNDSVHSDIL